MMHSFEVESIEKTGQDLKGIVVGKILEIKKHPNADKLQLARVDIAAKEVDIVCGAKNIKIGDKVPVALVGAKLPNGIEIREAEIRGSKSFGMLCAEDELGLGADHSGILILDKDAKVGMDFAKYCGGEDYALEIKVLADRSHDALSHVGLAREIVALQNKTIDYDYDGLKLPTKNSKILSVIIKDKKLCVRYIGAVIENVQINESPKWLQDRLKACGMRPINNVVDATNYVMLELGQPLHAFDVEKVKSKNSKANIIIRKAENNEEILLLDGSIKKLSDADLVIANKEKALAIAGIMGGVDSGISENTKAIVLESANFNALSIRKTRMALGIKTDASDRFEKNIDPNLAEKAMVRAIEIIERIAGGKTQGSVDIYPKPVKPWRIKMELDYVNKLLGENIQKNTAVKILKSLGLAVNGQKNEATIPTFRIDLQTQEDLIEEIGRIYGYEKIKPVAPVEKIAAAKLNEEKALDRKIKNILTGLGFDEVYSYSFYSEKDALRAGLEGIKHLELENPMSPEQELLRVNIIPNLLKNISENLKHFSEMSIFESGRVYCPNGRILPEEKKKIVIALVLERDSGAETFLALKGLVDSLLQKIGIREAQYKNSETVPADSASGLWHPTRSSEIKADGIAEKIGFMGEINPLILSLFKIGKRVAVAEFDLPQLLAAVPREKFYTPLLKYPVVSRDISMLAGRDVTVDEILKLIKKTGGELVLDACLFDIFEKDGMKSLAFHIDCGSKDRTLEGGEIELTLKKIIEKLEKGLAVKVRR